MRRCPLASSVAAPVRWTCSHALRLALLVVVGGVSGCAERTAARPPAAPQVPGLRDPALQPRDRGAVLLDELACAACHRPDGDAAAGDARIGPDLLGVAARIRADYLPRFLADPHGVEPGTTMPGLLGDLAPPARAAAAEALAHYLRSFPPPVAAAPAADPGDADAARRGHQLFHDIGCAACHAPRAADGIEQPMADSVPLGDLGAKYHFAGLQHFLLAPRKARPAARMPDLHLLPAEARDLATILLAGARPPVGAPDAVDPAKVAAGRALFAERGCANCHELADAARPAAHRPRPLAQLELANGCLGTKPGPWPDLELDDTQRADLTAALRALAEPASDEQRVRRRLASRNCLACHVRGEAGPARDRSNFFRGDANLGEDGRLPPPLTGVGAKLQPGWLVDVLAGGTSIRPYLKTRMPGFGDAFANELAPLLARVDQLPPLPLTPLPEDDKQSQAVRELGRALVGDQGMNCITCHAFAGEHVGTMVALDLVDTTAQRLRPDWFQHFLRAPFQFRQGTLMPQFFVDGVSARPALGGGDVQRQIEAMWHYLAEGRNVHKPDGMRRPPIPLVVGAEAVMLRRSVQNTGKRGISVGYPRGVNVTFDAESLGLDQIWWGGFVDAAGVWTGQGSGQARILGKDRATLAKGPAFVELPAPDAPWPTASRRELGQQWLGYDLGAAQRPTFRYVCVGVTIADTPVDLPDGAAGGDPSRALLRRTLTFTSPTDKTLAFRAARDPRIDDRGAGVVRVGRALQLRLPPDRYTIRTAGDQRELVVAIPIVNGRAELVVDYCWREEPK